MPYVYLIHAERPIPGSNCQHYLGYTGWGSSMKKRIAEHRANKGSVITREWNRLGIPYKIVRWWTRDPWTGEHAKVATEARFKRRTARWDRELDPHTGEMVRVRRTRASCNVKKMCPVCNPGNKRGLGAPPPYEHKREEVKEEDFYAPTPEYVFDDIPF